MDILYLLIPVSVLLAFIVLAVFAWAIRSGQFEEIEQEGERILHSGDEDLDPVQVRLDRDQGAP